ncbi:MAG: serine hydrolase domain-containing protein, partial [Syntrophales bacterium]
QPVGVSVPNPQPITIRSILTHHSGIPGDIMNWSTTLVYDPGFNDKLIAYLQGDYLAYPTNFMMDYSNSAISLLSSVIVSASGQTFETYSDALFQTLGMDQTSFFRSSAKITGFQAKGYEAGQEQPRYVINVTTAGSVISSVLDMAKFIKMVNAGGMGERGRVLDTSTLETMLTQTNGGMPLDSSRIGLSWFVNDPDLDYAGKLCWHNGQSSGFVSHLEILRDHKLGVVVLVNDATRNDVCTGIAKQALKLALAEKTGLNPPAPIQQTYGPLVVWDQARLDSLQGTYILSSAANEKGYITIRSVAGALEWLAPSGAAIHVAPRLNGWLSDPSSPGVEYEFGEIGGRHIIRIHLNGRNQVYAEYASPVVIPAAWSARVGSYTATDWVSLFPGEPLQLAVQDGMLLMNKTDVLAATSDTVAYVRGLGRGKGSAVKVVTVDGHEELQFLGVRYKKN